MTWHQSTSVYRISIIIAEGPPVNTSVTISQYLIDTIIQVPPSFRLGSPPLTQPTPPEDCLSPFSRPILASSSSSTHKRAYEYRPALENYLISLEVSDSQYHTSPSPAQLSNCIGALLEHPALPGHERFETSEVGRTGTRGLRRETDYVSIGSFLNSNRTKSSACPMPFSGLMSTIEDTLTKLPLSRQPSRAKISPTMLCARR